MTTDITTFETKFGKFVPCDKETYRKLKRINHFFRQRIEPWIKRWQRAQHRLPHNRYFVIRKVRYDVKDSWVFAPFYGIGDRTRQVWAEGEWKHDPKLNFPVKSAAGWKTVTEQHISGTELLKMFCGDYANARQPKDTAEAVTPLKLTVEQIDGLLAKAEEFAREAR